jgi:GH25 family lysozyme M1 (1,4-beta-N-acetylmuramidase)
MSKGIDVSHHQGAIDWRKVKAFGIDFAIIRAGRDVTVDRMFHQHIKGAIDAGLSVGVYWFSYALSKADAQREADFCLQTIKPYKLDLPVFYDYEYDSERYSKERGVTPTKRLRTDIVKAFCERIKASGYEVGIYTNIDYIINRLYWDELKHYPLWLAQFPLGEKDVGWTTLKPEQVNTKHGKPIIWQFGQARVDGYSKPVDANFGYMTLPEKVVPIQAKPAEPALKKGDKVKVINTTQVLNLRRGKLYGGGTFVVYRDSYDVIQVNGDRVVIGVGNAVTAAVHIKDLKKV